MFVACDGRLLSSRRIRIWCVVVKHVVLEGNLIWQIKITMAPSWQELPLSLDALLLLLQVQWRLFHEWVGSLPKLVRVVALMLSLVLVQVVAVQIFFGCLNLCANVRKTLNRVPLITGRTKKKKEVKTLVVLGSGKETSGSISSGSHPVTHVI